MTARAGHDEGPPPAGSAAARQRVTGRSVVAGERRLRDDPTLRVSGDMVRLWAVESGVCVRPLLRTVTDRATGEEATVPIRCGSTREQVCPSCAERARRVRMQQCREGWHLEEEPLPDLPEEDDADVDAPGPVEAQDGSGGEPHEDEVRDDEGRRVRSTRRRDDAVDLPRAPREDRTVGRTWVGRDGRTYRPSMFVTVTLPSYGRITPGTGTPVDPAGYDYRRAALDAIVLPQLLARWVQNLRRCAGYPVQYFAAVEPQRRLAPHVHLAIRGAVSRATLKAVTRATYVQVWWPPIDEVRYDESTGLPVWRVGDADAGYVDPTTGAPLPTWRQALDALDARLDADPSAPAAHVSRFGAQVDVKGIIAPSPDADRAIRYLTKYLTKSIAGTYTGANSDSDAATDGRAAAAYERHVDRLHEEVRWLPCSSACANWLRYGVQPEDAGPGLVPGACGKRAHDRENLGFGGRRVQVSRRWSGKTLAAHRADRASVVREVLAAAGIEAPDVDRLGVEEVLDDGLPRFVWADVPVEEGDYAAVILASVRERQRWREQYEQAKQQLQRAREGPGPVDSPLSNPPDDRAA
jgi:hypothetical protein